jgi:hypothetical protein
LTLFLYNLENFVIHSYLYNNVFYILVSHFVSENVVKNPDVMSLLDVSILRTRLSYILTHTIDGMLFSHTYNRWNVIFSHVQ